MRIAIPRLLLLAFPASSLAETTPKRRNKTLFLGEATVEILDEDMQIIGDFELSSSVPLRGRSIEQTVRWTTKANWSQSGGNVRLRIRLRNADLYAFWTAKE